MLRLRGGRERSKSACAHFQGGELLRRLTTEGPRITPLGCSPHSSRARVKSFFLRNELNSATNRKYVGRSQRDHKDLALCPRLAPAPGAGMSSGVVLEGERGWGGLLQQRQGSGRGRFVRMSCFHGMLLALASPLVAPGRSDAGVGQDEGFRGVRSQAGQGDRESGGAHLRFFRSAGIQTSLGDEALVGGVAGCSAGSRSQVTSAGGKPRFHRRMPQAHAVYSDEGVYIALACYKCL